MENRCPSCGSGRVEGTSRHLGCIGVLFWPLSLLFIKPRKRCKECAAIWRVG